MSWNLFTSRFKTQSFVERKSSLAHLDSSSKQWSIGPNWPLLEPIRRILSCVNASGYISQFTFRSLSADEKAFKYVKRMLPLFPAKYCSTNRLFYFITSPIFAHFVEKQHQELFCKDIGVFKHF